MASTSDPAAKSVAFSCPTVWTRVSGLLGVGHQRSLCVSYWRLNELMVADFARLLELFAKAESRNPRSCPCMAGRLRAGGRASGRKVGERWAYPVWGGYFDARSNKGGRRGRSDAHKNCRNTSPRRVTFSGVWR
jgi:hypothetical protein